MRNYIVYVALFLFAFSQGADNKDNPLRASNDLLKQPELLFEEIVEQPEPLFGGLIESSSNPSGDEDAQELEKKCAAALLFGDQPEHQPSSTASTSTTTTATASTSGSPLERLIFYPYQLQPIEVRASNRDFFVQNALLHEGIPQTATIQLLNGKNVLFDKNNLVVSYQWLIHYMLTGQLNHRPDIFQAYARSQDPNAGILMLTSNERTYACADRSCIMRTPSALHLFFHEVFDHLCNTT